MGRLAGRFSKAIVTGASSGLGLAFTRMLLSEGITVVGISRNPEIENPAGEYIPVECDLSDTMVLEGTLDHIFEHHEDVDLVINNAGFGRLGELVEISDHQISRQFSVMLVAPTLIAKRAITAFSSTGASGCLVNVTSLASELPIPLMPVYNSCKAGLSSLSDSLMLDASGAADPPVIIDFRPGDFCTEFAQRMEGESRWNGVELRAIMDRHHAEAPDASLAVEGLVDALVRGRSGRVRVGDLFQSKVAPLGPRLLPFALLRSLICWYYRQ